jgi:hypothetical protein
MTIIVKRKVSLHVENDCTHYPAAPDVSLSNVAAG